MIAKTSEIVDMPTSYGDFKMMVFNHGNQKHDHILLYIEKPDSEEPPLVRIHSECFTGDVIQSERCDCGTQLQRALKLISNNSYGYIVYLRQEGRGIGLLNKINAYALQDLGRNTVEANHELGFTSDSRDYLPAVDILKYMKVKNICLLTNNLDKLKQLQTGGIECSRQAIVVSPNENNASYLDTKKNIMGHIL